MDKNNNILQFEADDTSKTGINSDAIEIPSVTTDGLLVDVYVWFEGEDTHCMSDNLTTSLAAYDISICSSIFYFQ